METRIGNALGPYEDLLTSLFSEKTQTDSGTGTSHDHLDWPRLFCREQFKEGHEEATAETMGRQHQRVDWP